MPASKRYRLDRLKMIVLLEQLATIKSPAMSLYLPYGMPQAIVRNKLRELIGIDESEDIDEVIAGSKTGAVLFWGRQSRFLILPPFPIQEEYTAESYDVQPLLAILKYNYTIGVVLIRLGAYSIGILQGTKLIDSKSGTGLIHARHKKGGSSQGRFARHREKQIESFLTRVCGHVREYIEPQAKSLDYFVYGGARTTILLLQKQCPFLNQFDDRNLPMLLDVPDPRKTVLEEAITDIWSSNVIEWYENNI